MGRPGEGIEGNVPATYGDQSNTDYNVYFGGKLIWAEASAGLAAGPVGTDRLGSVVWRNGTANRYFPYGQEAAATGQDRTKFATYYRDETTSFDYARNRYYSTFIARFTTPDPYRASGGPADPQSWNRYSYTRGDPVNRADPSGLLDCPPISGAPVSVLRGPGTLISLAPGLDRQTTMGRQTTTPASRSPPCGGGSIPGTTRMRRTSTSSAPRTGRVVAAGARALGN
jgi:RHS repeat-associated protein